MKKKKNKLDESDLTEVKRLYYDEGLTQTRIGEIYGIDSSIVSKFFKERGLKVRTPKEYQILRGKSFRKKEELYQEFLKLLEQNSEDSSSIMVFCDVKKLSYSSFYQFVRKYHPECDTTRGLNTYSKRRQDSYDEKRKLKESDFDEIVRLYYVEKKSYKEIGEIFGYTSDSVCYYFKKYGLKPRSISENYTLALEKFPELWEKYRQEGFKAYMSRRSYGTTQEQQFAEYCTTNNIEFVEQYRKVGNAHPYDFFLPEYNTIVEIDGTYWHTKPEQKEKDEIQTEQALEKGYNVMRIDTDQLKKNNNNFDLWYNEIKKMERFNGERKRGRLLEVE